MISGINSMGSSESSTERIIKYREECRSTIELSPKIRYVGIINRFGRTLAGQLRKGVVPLFKPEEARNEFFIEATRSQLRKNFQTSIGKTSYTLTENEKVKILTISKEDNFYYVTIDNDASSEEISKIIELIRRSMYDIK
jgi:hypothetical protein